MGRYEAPPDRIVAEEKDEDEDGNQIRVLSRSGAKSAYSARGLAACAAPLACADVNAMGPTRHGVFAGVFGGRSKMIPVRAGLR